MSSGPMNDRGDRSKLTFDQRSLLETEVIPTARRWLDVPSLREHGEKTLDFWGETFPKKVGSQ